MRSCRWAPTVRRAALEPLPTSRAFSVRRATPQDGYVLLEIVCVLAIVALLATVILPAIPRQTTRARLEAYAVQAATLLKADRNAAVRRRIRIATAVDAETRTIVSGAGAGVLRLPADVRLDTMLASRCYDRPVVARIDFFPSGMSCGGALALTRYGNGYEVRVNWLTGGVDVVLHRPL